MYPTERSLVKKFADRQFALVGVNNDRDLQRLQPILAKEGITWPSFYEGPDEPISRAWNVRGWPSVRLIDGNGILRECGYRSEATLEARIEELLLELERPQQD